MVDLYSTNTSVIACHVSCQARVLLITLCSSIAYVCVIYKSLDEFCRTKYVGVNKGNFFFVARTSALCELN